MNSIIDIHNHLLPGVDDGSRYYEESVEILRALSRKGIHDVVLTSHYIENTKYCVSKKERLEILERLREKVPPTKMRLYLGNEVFTCANIIKLLKNGEITTINDSKYLLIELPLNGYIRQLPSILCDLTEEGIIPIIAHPERYQFLQRDPKKVYDLLEFNCLLQCNIDSIVGKYGKSAKKLMKWFLKKDLVTFVGTDTHSISDTLLLDKAYRKLKKMVKEEKYQEITYFNPLKVIQNKDMTEEEEYLVTI